MQSSVLQFFGSKDNKSSNKRQKVEDALSFRWLEHDSVLVLIATRKEKPNPLKYASGVTAFDMDGTLIKTKSGKVHAKDRDDWVLFSSNIPDILAEEEEKGRKIVILSNQLGIDKGKVIKSDLQYKAEKIASKLNVPLVAFFCTKDDLYRKPRTQTWQLLIDQYNEGKQPELDQCLYVGDAAGRLKSGPRKKDFSASDYKFALNVGLSFQTPEVFFLNAKEKLQNAIQFDPRTLSTELKSKFVLKRSETPELIVLVGPPASGKSRLCRDLLENYVRVNQDTLGSMNACKKSCLAALRAGKSVVIDNTNRSIKTRQVWIQIGKEQNLPIRCLRFDLPKELVLHLNKFRELTDASHSKVPTMAIHSFYKSIEPPDESEGFDQVSRLEFQLRKEFMSTSDVKLLTSFILG